MRPRQCLRSMLVLLCPLWMGIGAAASLAAPAVDPSPDLPDPQPADDLSELIEQLGDTDPKVREAASRRLEDMGKRVLPALQEAKDTDDPEIRARVRALIRKAERRLPPAAPVRNGIGHRTSVRVSQVNGEHTVDVDDNGYRIKIRQGTNGIVMDVTGAEDGKDVTETYKAKDADSLKRENPEAFALYDKYNSVGGIFEMRVGGFNGVRGARAVVQPAPIDKRMMEAQVAALERMIDQLQQHGANLPEEHRARLQEHADRLRQRQDDVQLKIQEQMDQNRRKALDQMKVPLRDEPAEAKKVEPED